MGTMAILANANNSSELTVNTFLDEAPNQVKLNTIRGYVLKTVQNVNRTNFDLYERGDDVYFTVRIYNKEFKSKYESTFKNLNKFAKWVKRKAEQIKEELDSDVEIQKIDRPEFVDKDANVDSLIEALIKAKRETEVKSIIGDLDRLRKLIKSNVSRYLDDETFDFISRIVKYPTEIIWNKKDVA